MIGKKGCWHTHHRMQWVIVIKSPEWYKENELNIMRWLDCERILVYNNIKNRIFYTAKNNYSILY